VTSETPASPFELVEVISEIASSATTEEAAFFLPFFEGDGGGKERGREARETEPVVVSIAARV